MSRSVAKVALYDRSMEEAFARFCQVVWPNSRDRATSSAQGPEEARGNQTGDTQDCPTFVFVKGDDIVGHVTTVPVRIASFGRTNSAHWIVGLMVLPEHRNSLVAPMLIKEVNQQLDCALSLHVEQPVLRILTGLKWFHKGVLPQYLRILNASEVSRNLRALGVKALVGDSANSTAGRLGGWVTSFGRVVGGWALGAGQALWVALTYVARPGAVRADVREENEFDESYDQLWRSVCARFGACVARDRKYLEERFARHPGGYRIFSCRQNDRLLGYCILKTKKFTNDPRLGNMRIGTIADCLFDPTGPAVLQRTVQRVLEICAEEKLHAVLCTSSHAAVRRVLRANGFLAIPGNLQFALHNRLNVPLQDIPLESWHLMRGDSDADQNF